MQAKVGMNQPSSHAIGVVKEEKQASHPRMGTITTEP
jgi:hypothetical protein